MDGLNFLQNALNVDPIIFWIMIVWTTAWKGVALWKASQKKQMPWFVVLLIVNTIGILEILYIFVFSQWKKKSTE